MVSFECLTIHFLVEVVYDNFLKIFALFFSNVASILVLLMKFYKISKWHNRHL